MFIWFQNNNVNSSLSALNSNIVTQTVTCTYLSQYYLVGKIESLYSEKNYTITATLKDASGISIDSIEMVRVSDKNIYCTSNGAFTENNIAYVDVIAIAK